MNLFLYYNCYYSADTKRIIVQDIGYSYRSTTKIPKVCDNGTLSRWKYYAISIVINNFKVIPSKKMEEVIVYNKYEPVSIKLLKIRKFWCLNFWTSSMIFGFTQEKKLKNKYFYWIEFCLKFRIFAKKVFKFDCSISWARTDKTSKIIIFDENPSICSNIVLFHNKNERKLTMWNVWKNFIIDMCWK